MKRDRNVLRVTGRGLSIDFFQMEYLEAVVDKFIRQNSRAVPNEEVTRIYQYNFSIYELASYRSALRLKKLVLAEFPALSDRISTFDIDDVIE